MGDYCKLIVACTVKEEAQPELNIKIEQLNLCTSAYQSEEILTSVMPCSYFDRKKDLNIIIVGQTRLGRGQDEFCEWLRPFVRKGSGLNNVYAMSFSEYSDTPKIWKLTNHNEYEI